MLGGEYRHGLDAKNRIFVPAKLRDELGETLVVSKAIRDNCLKVYSLEGWEAYIAPIKAQKRKLSEKTLRFLHSSLLQAEPDKQGRILLTPELISYAGIKGNAVFVGCGDYAEIWSDTSYDKINEEIDLDEMIAELEELGL